MSKTDLQEMENERYDEGVNCCDISVIYLEDIVSNPTDDMIEFWDKEWNGLECDGVMGEKHYEMMKEVIYTRFLEDFLNMGEDNENKFRITTEEE